jgi:hypothetical protein
MGKRLPSDLESARSDVRLTGQPEDVGKPYVAGGLALEAYL